MLPPPEAPAPSVSVIMTVREESKHLRESVESVLAQEYGGELEVVISVGRSRDGTRALADALAVQDRRVQVLDNPDPGGSTPAGLNAAIARSRHAVVARVDGHAVLPPGYVATAVETLLATGADNVGGVMAAEGATRFERVAAHAMTSRLGVGNAAFHTGGAAGPADTVYLGVFRRAALERVGGYDEFFQRAQDWELNYRIRRSGGLVWFDPRLRVSYRPRSTPARLARQYFDYGRWRRVIVGRDRATVSWRYLAPPATLLGTSVGTVTGLRWRPAFAVPAAYLAVVTAGGWWSGRHLGLLGRASLPPVFALMHMAWGAGFLLGQRPAADTSTPPSARVE